MVQNRFLRRIARVALVLLVGLGVGAGCLAEIDRSQLIGLAGTVLKIEADRMQGGYSLGSGVAIAPEHVVTNCHVTRDAQQLYVLRGGARWPVVAQLRDVEHDLCLLLVPRLQATVAALADVDRLEPGQAVSALGYTGGLNMQYSEGKVVALHRLDQGRVIQSTNWFNSGASGGGLFDASFRLVGILTFRLRGGDAHYFAAPAMWLSSLLDAPVTKYETVSPDRSARLPYWQRAMSEQPRFLRAGSMERDYHWEALRLLADEWTHDDGADAEPWFLLGMALSHLDQPIQAQMALRCSIAIEPRGQAAQLLPILVAGTSTDHPIPARALEPTNQATQIPHCGAAEAKDPIR